MYASTPGMHGPGIINGAISNLGKAYNPTRYILYLPRWYLPFELSTFKEVPIACPIAITSWESGMFHAVSPDLHESSSIREVYVL